MERENDQARDGAPDCVQWDHGSSNDSPLNQRGVTKLATELAGARQDACINVHQVRTGHMNQNVPHKE